jgi:hypothetical protein
MTQPVKLINVKDLHKQIDDKELKKNEIYNNILLKCQEKILQATKNNDMCCFYPLPEFIIGRPLFHAKTCRDYIISKLEDSGFLIKYTHPNLLYISWLKKEKPEKKMKNKSHTKQNNSKYRVIDDYEPSGKFTYTPSSLSSIKEKTQYLLNN